MLVDVFLPAQFFELGISVLHNWVFFIEYSKTDVFASILLAVSDEAISFILVS